MILECIYPENISCIICNNPIKKNNTYSLCKTCFNEIHFIKDGCEVCGKPIANHILEEEFIEKCRYCINKTFYFDKAISCIEYSDVSKKLILGLKYNNKTYISKYIAQIMKHKLDIDSITFDYILFVPLHKNRLKKRGFNQSQKIAKYLGKLLDISTIDGIDRINNTKMLYRLTKAERTKELRNAFKLKISKESIINKNIIIIDDIFTTGSTVNEISKILKVNGVNNIYVLTLLTRNSDSY